MPSLTFKAACSIQATADKPPRVSILAYTGGPMRLPGLGLTVVDLAGMALDSIPLLADHDNHLGSIAGTGTPKVEGGRLLVEGTLASGTAAGNQILALHRGGVRLQASIGAEVEASQYIDAGKNITANGRTHVAPADGLTFVSKSKLREVSFVAAGADSQTSVSIAARRKSMQSAKFENWGRQMLGASFDSLDSDELASLHANYIGRDGATAADFTATAGFIQAGAELDDEERRLRAVERSLAREERIKNLEAKLPMAHTVSAPRNRGTDNNVLTAALCLSAGVQSPNKHFDERTLDAADKHRGLGIQQVLLQAAVANGYQPTGSIGINQANLRQVLAHALPQIQATGFSTMNVSTIVSNTANKFLLEGWNSVDQTLLRISAVRSVRDFKQVTVVSLTGGMDFEQVAADGELKHKAVGERTYTNQAYTYGAITAITRQDIINDDTGALSSAPRKIGRGGMLKLNNIGWTAFLGGETAGFFSASHTNPTGNSNLNSGAADMTLGGIAATEKLFINQIDPDGNPLGIMPAILLVPPTLRAAAMTLMNSQLIISGTATASQPSGNAWQGRFRVESSPYMEISTYTGYSNAAWYLLAEPSQMAVIEIAALNGRVEPTVETAEADFAQLGIQMRGYSDVGVSLMEYRGGVKADGGAS